MMFKVGDIIKWDDNAAKAKDFNYGYVTRIEREQYIYVRWFHLDYDQNFTHSTATRLFKVIS